MSSSNESNVGSNVEIESIDDRNVSRYVIYPEKSLEEEMEVAFSPQKNPPNGGSAAWLQVLGGFFALFNSWGVINTFGAYESYYQDDLLKNESPSTIAWIGSIQGFLIVAGTIVAGRPMDAGFGKTTLYIGSFLVTFGMMMASFSTEWYQLFLSQGICTGFGSSLLFLAAVAIVSQYFTTKRSLALGLVASGSSFGGIVYPIMVRRLIVILGFPWATRILAFTILATCAIPCILLRPHLPPRKSGPLIDGPSLVDWPYMLYTFAMFFAFMGVYVPIFFIQSYAIHVGINPDLAFYMTSILNCGLVARILPNFLADKLGPLNVLLPAVICSCVLLFSWIGISSQSGVIAFSVLFGFFSGTIVSLPPACIASMTKDFSILGTRMGMSFFVGAFGLLIGTPVAGAIIHRQGGDFFYAKVFAGITTTLSFCLMLAARLLTTGFVWKRKC